MEFGERVKAELLLEVIVKAYEENNLEPVSKSDMRVILEDFGIPQDYDLKSWFKGLEEEGLIEKVGNKWKPTFNTLMIYGL